MDFNLKQIFSSRQKNKLIDKNLKTAAVLVPLFNDGKEYHVLLTQRSDDVLLHKGQISFPGGKPHKTDANLLDTALRESWEEIGLKPKDAQIIGELDDTPTKVTGFIISPFVALIPYPYEFIKNPRETTEILFVPLSVLMDNSNFNQEPMDNDGIPNYTYEYKGRIIWGATARIIKQLLDTLRAASGARQ